MEVKGEISTITDSDSGTKITDGDNELALSKSGGIKLFDTELKDLLSGMTKELKIINLHLSILTDNVITKQEVE